MTDGKEICLSPRVRTNGKKGSKNGGQYTVTSGPKCFGYHGFRHMKQEYPTYLKATRKSKALVATLSDTKTETESNDSNDEGILNAFTATVDPPEGIMEVIDDKEDLVESKFENMDEQDDIHTASEKHEKLYSLATKKLSDVKLDREELSTKFDEANQTIRALWFEKNFLT